MNRPSLVCSGGSLSLGGLPISLSNAEWLGGILSNEALLADRAGLDSRPAARQAVQVYSAIGLCSRWRRASGWANPHDADRTAISASVQCAPATDPGVSCTLRRSSVSTSLAPEATDYQRLLYGPLLLSLWWE